MSRKNWEPEKGRNTPKFNFKKTEKPGICAKVHTVQ